MRDPGAPMAVVAQEAGVGVGGLYRRYTNKDELLQTLCREGLQRFVAAAQHALERGDDPWSALAGFVTDIVESDVHALTVHLAGTFTPSANTTIVLNVDSCADAVAELRKRGVRCDDPIGIPGMVTYASFYDPFGNRLQMCSDPPDA